MPAETPRQRHLRVKYGITEEQYEWLAARYEGRCYICQKVPKGRLQVDHDHKTGEIRGTLCWWCNKSLGYQWTHDRLLAAAEYMDPNNYTGLFVPPKKKRRRKKKTT